MTAQLSPRNRPLILTAAAAAPLVVCTAMIPLREDRGTNIALVLVLVVVAVASSGLRPAGVIAALSSAVWFDFFLTEPYQRFTMTDRADIETTALLVLVGGGVTEIALWGRREQARSSRREGYLAGVVSAAGSVAVGGSTPQVLIEHVEAQLTEVLGIDGCHFDQGTDTRLPRIGHDGAVSRNGQVVEVNRVGLPTDSEIELPVQSGGRILGRFLLTAATRVARPDLEQRLVAIALADQVGASLAAHEASTG